jgi:soluble lytic murein transglycosylase-like protein
MTKVTCTSIMLIVCFCLYNNACEYYAYRDFYPTLDRETYEASKAACEKYGVDLSLHLALGWTESGFVKQARSSAGARGVFQVMPSHYLKDPDRLYDVRFNAMMSAQILADYTKRARGNIAFGLAKYNSGPNRDMSKYKYFRTYVLTILDNSRAMGYVYNGG